MNNTKNEIADISVGMFLLFVAFSYGILEIGMDTLYKAIEHMGVFKFLGL